MKPKPSSELGPHGYNVDIALRTRATADVQGADANGVSPAGPPSSKSGPRRSVRIDTEGFSTIVRRSKRFVTEETEDRDLQPQDALQKENELHARSPSSHEATHERRLPESLSGFQALDGDVSCDFAPVFARTKQSARRSTANAGSDSDISLGGGAAEQPAAVGSRDSDSGDSHIVRRKGSTLSSVARKKGPARKAPSSKPKATKQVTQSKTAPADGQAQRDPSPSASEPKPTAVDSPQADFQKGNSDSDHTTPSPLIPPSRYARHQWLVGYEQEFCLHQTSTDGDCLPDSIQSAIAERIRLSGWHLPFQMPDTVDDMRQALCDFAEQNRYTMLATSLGMSPDDAVRLDYIHDRQYVVDPDFERSGIARGEPDPHRHINSWEDYIDAMRSPHASMDEIMVQLAALMFGVRIVILGRRQRKVKKIYRWDIQHDICPDGVSLDRYIILVHTPGHYEWAHPAAFRCSSFTCLGRFAALLDRSLPAWSGGTPFPHPPRRPQNSHERFTEMEDFALALKLELEGDGHSVTLEDVTAALWLTRNADGSPSIHKALQYLPGASLNPFDLPDTPPEAPKGKHATANAAKRKLRDGDESDGSACRKVSFDGDGDDEEDEDAVGRNTGHPPPPPNPPTQTAQSSAKRNQQNQRPIHDDHWDQGILQREKQVREICALKPYPATAPTVAGRGDVATRVAEELQARNAAVDTIKLITGCSDEAAQRELEQQLGVTCSLHEAITRACGRLHPAAHQRTFLENELGNGVRAATVPELAKAHAPASTEEPLQPVNLQDFYTRTSRELANPDIQNLPAKRRLQLAHRRADSSLHDDAVAAAAWRRDFITPPNTISAELEGDAAPQPALRVKPISSASQHPSPAVRIAHVRQTAAASPGGGNVLGGSVVVVGGGGRNLPLWLPGAETDGKGFHYSTKQSMVHACVPLCRCAG